jgi:hypothetical protein
MLTIMMYTVGDYGHVPVDLAELNLKPLLKYQQFLEQQKLKVQPAAESNAAIDWTQVINYAQKAWQFIQDNKAVSDYQRKYANALPGGVGSAFELSNWSAPNTRSYKIVYKNLLSVTILEFVYTVSYTYGGQYQGKGRYLDHITVLPTNVFVQWGWNFQASVSVPSIVNTGSSASPVAGASVELSYKLKALNSVERTESFFVKGDGYFQWRAANPRLRPRRRLVLLHRCRTPPSGAICRPANPPLNRPPPPSLRAPPLPSRPRPRASRRRALDPFPVD